MALYDGMLALKVPSEATVYLSPSNQTLLPALSVQRKTATHVFPAQAPSLGEPATTSQYVPEGRPLENVVLHVEPSLLIATNATEPRAKAIC